MEGPAAMSLLYTEVEDELRATVREVLADRSPWTAVLKRTESDEPHDTALRRLLGTDVGVAALAVPEKFGGAGASWRGAAVGGGGLGRAGAPGPFLGSSVAPAALLALGRDDLLAVIAAGGRTVVPAVPLSATYEPVPATTVTADGDTLTGRITSVADAPVADVLLVYAGEA